MKKNIVLITRIFLTLVVIIAALSFGYLLVALIAFAGMLDNGGTGTVLELMKNPVFSGIIFGSIIWSIFLKRTRRRMENLVR